MRYVALAVGFDGTLARNGQYDERCLDSLRSLAATGRKLILVTGRTLRQLLEAFPEARLFDYVVAENGAVMYRSATRQSAILAQAPPEILLQELQRRGVSPLSVGSSSITTLHSQHALVAEALRKLALDCQIVANDGVLSILPSEVDKAYGVGAALRELGVSPHNLVAIGDGQNDLALFALAEHAAAVRNADPALKRAADRVTHGAWSDGFLELAHELMATDLAAVLPRRRILLGRDEESREISFAPCRDSLLVCGPRGAGKAAVCEQLIDQLLAQEYQCCILDVGSMGTLSRHVGVSAFGEPHEAPRLSDVTNALEQGSGSIAVNLAALPLETRPVFAEALLLQLQALHDRVGRPHCVFINEAHCFIAREAQRLSARSGEITMIYATSEPQQLAPYIFDDVKMIVALGSASDAPEQLRPWTSRAAQATTAGGVFRMSVFGSAALGAERASSDGAVAASGY
jgi:hydroxymethylpyrimidine pyrophosphatase-like HAD family hydrolase